MRSSTKLTDSGTTRNRIQSLEDEYAKAARLIDQADGLIIGAGMGIDSVLPDFRGPGGFWKVRALGPTGLLDSGHSLCISERRLSGKLLVGTVPIGDTGQMRAHRPL